MATIRFTLNGKPQAVDVNPEMPLLWVLRDTLGLTGTKFGCGMAICGACTVHINGTAMRSCAMQAAGVAGKNVVTIEGLSADGSHPVQKAWIEKDVPQCGYCQSGQIMGAAALLAKNSKPSDADIDEVMKFLYLPVRHLSGYSQCDSPGCRTSDERRRGMNSSRRGFLKSSAAGAAGLVIGFYLPERSRLAAQASITPVRVNAWVRVGTDDTVTLMIHKSEMGQGTVTSAFPAACGRTGMRLEEGPHRISGHRFRVWTAGRVWQHEHTLGLGSAAQCRGSGA